MLKPTKTSHKNLAAIAIIAELPLKLFEGEIFKQTNQDKALFPQQFKIKKKKL